MFTDGRCPYHPDAHFTGNPCGLEVKIVEHLDMIACEPERHDHCLLAGNTAQCILYVRLQPGIVGTTAPALKRERPASPSELLSDSACRLIKLLDISRQPVHRKRNAMSGENQLGSLAA